jgi:hypothetical protein
MQGDDPDLNNSAAATIRQPDMFGTVTGEFAV